MDKINVLHFYKNYYPTSYGGVEKTIYEIAKGSSKSNISTQVLSIADLRKETVIKIDKHISVLAKNDFTLASTKFSLSSFFIFKKMARKSDVIHFHFPWPFMDLVYLLSGLKKPTVVTYHSDIIRQKYLFFLYWPLMRLFLNKIDVIVATSPNYLSTSKILKKYQHKVTVIPNGIDIKNYPAPDSALLDKWKNKIGPKYFLFVGVLRYYKGLHILIDAMVGVDYPVVIVGSGPIEDELKKQVINYGLKNVYFLGQLPEGDKVALLQSCLAVVFPSHLRSEAFGISLLEGAMFAKPLISSEIGTGTSYINIDGKTGLVVNPDDPLDLRKAMQKLWNDEKLCKKLGQNALVRYKQKFTGNIMARSYIKLYREMTGKGDK